MRSTDLTRRTALSAAALILATPAIVRAQTKALRIGAPLPVTGGLAPEATKLRHGFDLWADAVSAAGGLRVGDARVPVEIVYADYESNTPKAVQLAERLITQDGCTALFGPQGSGATKAASSVAERYRVPMIASTASSREVFDQHYKFLFGTLTPNETLTEPLADIVKAQAPSVTRVAILARNDLFPLAIAQEMEKSAKARGLEVAVFERFAIGTMDHASALTRIAASEPHWIFATGYLNDLILIRRQMAELKLQPPVITMIAGPAYREFVAALGPLAEGLTTAAWWHPAVRYENGRGPFASSVAYTEAFRAKFGAEPDYGEASSSACGTLLELAAEDAGSVEPVKLRDALAAIDAMTFFGRIRFNATGQADTYTPPVMQVRGGKPLVLYPREIREADFQLIG
jgi:branched-chain amino acid transport system substrate-binding protein